MDVLLAALALAVGWPGPAQPPRVALATVRLAPVAEAVAVTCRAWQRRARLPLLCPRRLPRATLAMPPGSKQSPPAVRVSVVGDPRRPGRVGLLGFEFGYSAPVEPTSGRGWRRHLWWNRPCCFLHFGVYRLVPPAGRVPHSLARAALGGKRGLLRRATGLGLRGSEGAWWANHAWFFWRERSATYVATLHFFGRGTETRRLLGRLIRELRPARSMR